MSLFEKSIIDTNYYNDECTRNYFIFMIYKIIIHNVNTNSSITVYEECLTEKKYGKRNETFVISL